LVLAFALLGVSQTQEFKIAGKVMRQTGNPIRGARVSVWPVQQANRQLSCVTGESGEFAFSGLPAGKYSLRVSYHGWTQAYRESEGYSTAIAAGPGLDSEHIAFAVDSPASIAGSVVDDVGDPVRNATVYLFGRSVSHGRLETGLKSTVVTATDGSFHFAHLVPGTYYVAVTGIPWYAQMSHLVSSSDQQRMTRPDLDVAYPFTYYADARTFEGATPLKLEEGARAEIRFTLQAVPALHITLDGIERPPDQQILGSVYQIGPDGTLVSVQAAMVNSVISGIAPGDYVLSALLSGQNQPIVIGSQAVSLSSDSTVHVSDAIKTSVSGKIVLDGDVPPMLAVVLQSVTDGSQAVGWIVHDGSFTIPDVKPGQYDLRLGNTTELYVRSVTPKGAPYSKGQLEVSPGAQVELTIEAARGMSKVEGIAVRDHKPFPGAMVLLLPLDVSRSNYIPRDQSDSDGTFTLNWAAPGRYTVVAIDNGRDLEYAKPAVIAPYLQGGRVIDVPLPKNATVEVEVQTRR
jgi:protocatechuate 3,4-dioxygenase beta subunit